MICCSVTILSRLYLSEEVKSSFSCKIYFFYFYFLWKTIKNNRILVSAFSSLKYSKKASTMYTEKPTQLNSIVNVVPAAMQFLY